MVYLIIYSFVVLLIFIFALLFALYSTYSLIANFMGSPYVPTKQKEVEIILKKARLKKGQTLIELGSGDGRVVRTAVKTYEVKGIGVEIHPLLLWYSRIMAKKQGLRDISFKKENFFKTDLTKADVIFLFLMPQTLQKLKKKILKESKEGTLIISHGFTIEGWEKYLKYQIKNLPFPSYFYKI